MLDTTFQDRVTRLISDQLIERRRVFPIETSRLAADMSARGALHSSGHLLTSKSAHERELEVRAIIVWQSTVRVHKIFGGTPAPNLRDDFKTLLRQNIENEFRELNASYTGTANRFGGGRGAPDLLDLIARTLTKHELEVDLYVDSLQTSKPQAGATPLPTYNFYGNVGAVQTGSRAVANTVQNLASEDKAELSSALKQVADALNGATSLQERQRQELLELVNEAKIQLDSASPNSTKLLTTFNVLAATIQAIPSAQPAYQVLKGALLPLGVILP